MLDFSTDFVVLIPPRGCGLALSSKSYPFCALALDFVWDVNDRVDGSGGGGACNLTWGRKGPPGPMSISSSSSNGEPANGSGVGARSRSVIGDCNRCCRTGVVPAAGSLEGDA